MADRRIGFLAEARDAMSGVIRKTSRAFESLRESVEDTGQEATQLGVNFRELDRMLDEVGVQATPTTANRFRLLKDAIDNTVTSDDIISVSTLREEIGSLAEDTTLTESTVENLKDAATDLRNEFFSANLSAESLRESIDDLGNSGDLTADEVRVLNQAIDRVATRGDIHSVEELTQEVTRLGITMLGGGEAAEELDRELRSLLVTELQASGATSNLTFSQLGLSQALERSEEKAQDFRDDLGLTQVTMASFSAQTLATALVVEGFAATFEDAEEEFEQFRETVRDILPENPITTLNLGPVNISLKNMITTVVSLTMTIGTLITTILGLATALTAIVAAFGSIFALGALQFLDQIERRFASITSRAEAMEALMKGLMRSVMDALEPLESATIGGLGPVGVFVQSIRGLMRVIRQFAEIMAAIAGMDEFQEFVERVSEALFTADAGPTMMEALTDAVETLGPMLTDFIVWFINNLPEFISFMTEIAEDVGPALATIGLALIPVFATLIRIGSALFQAIANVVRIVGGAISILADLWSGLNDLLGPTVDLNDAVIALAEGFFTIVVGIAVLSTALSILTSMLGAALIASKLYTAMMGFVGSSSLSAATGVTVLTHALRALLITSVVGLILVAISMLVFALLSMGDTIKFIENLVQDTFDVWSDLFEWLGLTAEQADLLAAVMFGPLLAPLMAVKEVLKFIMDPIATMQRWWETIIEGIEDIIDTVYRLLNIDPDDDGGPGPGGNGPGPPGSAPAGSRGRGGSGSTTFNITVNGGDAERNARWFRREARRLNRDENVRNRGLQGGS